MESSSSPDTPNTPNPTPKSQSPVPEDNPKVSEKMTTSMYGVDSSVNFGDEAKELEFDVVSSETSSCNGMGAVSSSSSESDDESGQESDQELDQESEQESGQESDDDDEESGQEESENEKKPSIEVNLSSDNEKEDNEKDKEEEDEEQEELEAEEHIFEDEFGNVYKRYVVMDDNKPLVIIINNGKKEEPIPNIIIYMALLVCGLWLLKGTCFLCNLMYSDKCLIPRF